MPYRLKNFIAWLFTQESLQPPHTPAGASWSTRIVDLAPSARAWRPRRTSRSPPWLMVTCVCLVPHLAARGSQALVLRGRQTIDFTQHWFPATGCRWERPRAAWRGVSGRASRAKATWNEGSATSHHRSSKRHLRTRRTYMSCTGSQRPLTARSSDIANNKMIPNTKRSAPA
jgi:hypothetical protein